MEEDGEEDIPPYFYLTAHNADSPLGCVTRCIDFDRLPSDTALETLLHLVSYSKCIPLVDIVLQKLLDLIGQFGDPARIKLSANGSLNAMILLFARTTTKEIFAKIVAFFNVNNFQVESMEMFQIVHLSNTLASCWSKVPPESVWFLLKICTEYCQNDDFCKEFISAVDLPILVKYLHDKSKASQILSLLIIMFKTGTFISHQNLLDC